MPIINQVVSGGGPTGLYRELQLDSNGRLVASTTTTHVMDFTGVTDIGDYMLAYAYWYNTHISGTINMSNLTQINGANACVAMFSLCSGVTSANMPLLATISGQYSCSSMFSYTGVTSVNLNSLTTVSGSYACNSMFSNTPLASINLPSLETVSSSNGFSSAFTRCTSLAYANFPALTTLSGGAALNSAFYGCTSLTYMDFPSLSVLTGGNSLSGTFTNCTSLIRVSFYALNTNSFGTRTNQFSNMLSGCTNVTVHFPMAIQSTIGSWADVTAGFGGANTTVLFDIVTTLTGADSNTYIRTQKSSTSTATAWTYNDTLYYTSGTSEPSVGDTIYSDAACTTAVTTISSIA